MERERVSERPTYARRVVFAEDPRVASDLEQRAVEHGRSVAAEVRAAVREHLRREEQPGERDRTNGHWTMM
jgi:plasmid stability protein